MVVSVVGMVGVRRGKTSMGVDTQPRRRPRSQQKELFRAALSPDLGIRAPHEDEDLHVSYSSPSSSSTISSIGNPLLLGGASTYSSSTASSYEDPPKLPLLADEHDHSDDYGNDTIQKRPTEDHRKTGQLPNRMRPPSCDPNDNPKRRAYNNAQHSTFPVPSPPVSVPDPHHQQLLHAASRMYKTDFRGDTEWVHFDWSLCHYSLLIFVVANVMALLVSLLLFVRPSHVPDMATTETITSVVDLGLIFGALSMALPPLLRTTSLRRVKRSCRLIIAWCVQQLVLVGLAYAGQGMQETERKLGMSNKSNPKVDMGSIRQELIQYWSLSVILGLGGILAHCMGMASSREGNRWCSFLGTSCFALGFVMMYAEYSPIPIFEEFREVLSNIDTSWSVPQRPVWAGEFLQWLGLLAVNAPALLDHRSYISSSRRIPKTCDLTRLYDSEVGPSMRERCWRLWIAAFGLLIVMGMLFCESRGILWNAKTPYPRLLSLQIEPRDIIKQSLRLGLGTLLWSSHFSIETAPPSRKDTGLEPWLKLSAWKQLLKKREYPLLESMTRGTPKEELKFNALQDDGLLGNRVKSLATGGLVTPEMLLSGSTSIARPKVKPKRDEAKEARPIDELVKWMGVLENAGESDWLDDFLSQLVDETDVEVTAKYRDDQMPPTDPSISRDEQPNATNKKRTITSQPSDETPESNDDVDFKSSMDILSNMATGDGEIHRDYVDTDSDSQATGLVATTLPSTSGGDLSGSEYIAQQCSGANLSNDDHGIVFTPEEVGLESNDLSHEGMGRMWGSARSLMRESMSTFSNDQLRELLALRFPSAGSPTLSRKDPNNKTVEKEYYVKSGDTKEDCMSKNDATVARDSVALLDASDEDLSGYVRHAALSISIASESSQGRRGLSLKSPIRMITTATSKVGHLAVRFLRNLQVDRLYDLAVEEIDLIFHYDNTSGEITFPNFPTFLRLDRLVELWLFDLDSFFTGGYERCNAMVSQEVKKAMSKFRSLIQRIKSLRRREQWQKGWGMTVDGIRKVQNLLGDVWETKAMTLA